MGIAWKLREMRNERRFRRERAKKGYCIYDLWAMDDWFISIIPKMLREFKEKNWCYPTLWVEEWYEQNKERCNNAGINEDNFYIVETGGNTDEQEQLRADLSHYQSNKWKEILDRMIFLFEESNEETCKKKNPYEEEHSKQFSIDLPDRFFSKKELRERKKNPPQRDEEAYEKLCKAYQEEDLKLEEYREQCEKEAIELFVKYLHNLWW